MKKRTSHTSLALVFSSLILSATLFSSPTAAQSGGSAPASMMEAVNALPASDGVVLVNVQRLLREALPRVLPPEEIAELNLLGEGARLQTGVDLQRLESIAVGIRTQKLITSRRLPEYCFVLKGAFDSAQLLKTLRESGAGKFREEQYRGRSIYFFDLDLILGVPPAAAFPPFLRGVALSILDERTLVIGGHADVQRTVDAAEGQGRINPQLVKLATSAPGALISIAALGLKTKDPTLITTNWQTSDELTQALESIDQLSASLTMKAGSFEFLLLARTGNSRQAELLKNILLPLIHQAASTIKDARLRDIVDTLQVNTESNTLHARTEIPQALLATLVKEAVAPPPTSINAQQQRKPKARRLRRRR